MARLPTALCATLLLVLTLVACGGDGTTPRSPATPSPSSAAAANATETPGEAPPLPADILELIDEVAALRQLEAPPTLRIRTVTPRDLPDEYIGALTDEEQFAVERLTKLYRLLGYLDEDQHLRDIRRSLAGNIAGFYSFDDKTVWVVTEEEGVEPGGFTPSERETLVHEIIHVLQDYHFDLVANYENLWWDLDALLAFGSVIEGDATVHTDRYAGRARSIPAGAGRYFLVAANQLTDVPAPIAREFDFPYTAGADWAREVLASHGVETLNAFLAEPPPATALILHPELVDTGWEPEQVSSLDFPGLRVSLLPLGLRPTAHGSLGEFHLLNYLLGDAPSSPDWFHDDRNQAAVEAAAGWAGDYYYLYEGVENWVVVARVRFVSEEDAREFAEVQRAVATSDADVEEEGALTLATGENGNVTVLLEPVGRDVIFAIGTNAEVARAAVEPLVEG